jgi:hypothetical protein
MVMGLESGSKTPGSPCIRLRYEAPDRIQYPGLPLSEVPDEVMVNSHADKVVVGLRTEPVTVKSWFPFMKPFCQRAPITVRAGTWDGPTRSFVMFEVRRYLPPETMVEVAR